MDDSFKPAWWCRGPHVQTLWSYLIRRRPHVTLRRERLELPDGDFLDLDWTPNTTGPIVVILHGLEGSSDSPYARGMLRAISLRGWRGVLMHFRGCSGEPNRRLRRYHSGETGDFAHFVEVLRQREPHTPLAAVGYSLGGNVLLKWMGEVGQQANLSVAVAVSVPFVLSETASRMEQGFSQVYQWRLLHRLHRSIQEKRQRRSLPPLTLSDLSALRTFRGFDEHVTARLYGFDGADHYYRVSSSRQYLKGITINTLLLHAQDDPFMFAGTVPHRDELSGSTTLELSAHGGHVGFVSGRWPWSARYWLEERIPRYLGKFLTQS